MAYDPTKNAQLLNVLLARADARQFTTTQVVTTTLRRGTHPSQGVFPHTTNETHYRLTWSAVYRGQHLVGTNLVVPAPLLALGVAASLGEARDAFDLTDVRLERLGANPNTLSPAREGFWSSPQPIQLDSVAPASGSNAGGAQVVVRGSGLARAKSIKLGALDLLSLQVLSDKVAVGVTPATSLLGAVDVRVESVYGRQYDGVLKAAFTWHPPPTQIFSISPNNGPISGGTPVTISGISLSGQTVLQLGEPGNYVPITVLTDDGTTITGVTTYYTGPQGPVDLVITTPNGTATLPGAFTYAMQIDAAFPSYSSFTDLIGNGSVGEGLPPVVVRGRGFTKSGRKVISAKAAGVTVSNLLVLGDEKISFFPGTVSAAVSGPIVLTLDDGSTISGGSMTYWDPTVLGSARLVAYYDFNDILSMTRNGSNIAAIADKSGNGNNAIQSTPANQFTFINGDPEFFNQTVLYGGASGGGSQSLIAANAKVTGEPYTIVMIGAFDGAGSSNFLWGAINNPGASLVLANSLTVYDQALNNGPSMNPLQFNGGLSPVLIVDERNGLTGSKLYLNSMKFPAIQGETGSSGISGGIVIGNNPGGGTNIKNSRLSKFMVIRGTLTNAEKKALGLWAAAIFNQGKPNPSTQDLVSGNSFTFGWRSSNYNVTDYADLVSQMLPFGTSFAKDGTVGAQTNGLMACTSSAPKVGLAQTLNVFAMEGTNEVTNNVDAPTMYSHYMTWLANLRKLGANVTFGDVIPAGPAVWNSTQQAARTALNAMLLAGTVPTIDPATGIAVPYTYDHPIGYRLVTVSALPALQNPASLVAYADDQEHPNSLGHEAMAAVIGPAMLLPPLGLTIASLSQSTASAAGGTAITVLGNAFTTLDETNVATVQLVLGGIGHNVPYVVYNDATINMTTPALPAGAYTLKVGTISFGTIVVP